MSKDYMKIQSVTIDYLRPLLAIMVVGLHVRPYYTTGTELFFDGTFEALVITIFRVLFSMAVPFFFLISGYFFYKGLQDWDKSVWSDKIRKRIRTLLVPYLLWNLIAFAGYCITRFAGHVIKGVPFPDLIEELSERGWIRLLWDRCLYGDIKPDVINLFGYAVSTGSPMNGPTWFLRDLFVVLLFTPVIWWLIRHLKKSFIIIAGILYVVDLWFPFAGFSSKAFFMFSLGAWLFLTGNNLVSISQNHPRIQALTALALLLVAAMSLGYNEWIYCILSRLFIVCAIPVLFRMVAKKVMTGETATKKWKQDLSNSSFFVYVVHTVLITDAINWVILSLAKNPCKPISFTLLIISTLTVYMICHLLWLFFNRITPRTMNILTGNRSSGQKQN